MDSATYVAFSPYRRLHAGVSIEPTPCHSPGPYPLARPIRASLGGWLLIAWTAQANVLRACN